MDSPGRIVVGIDGSGPATDALEWSLEYAQMAAESVRVVAAWTFPAYYGLDMAPTEGWDIEGETRKVAGEQLKAALARFPEVSAELTVEHGHPAQVLVDASREARLLVVGSRGHGGFTGMFLGSVSTHCAHAAHCPVVVVR